MVVNVYNDSIKDDERIQVYRQILQLFISSGGSMNNGNERDKHDSRQTAIISKWNNTAAITD